ncbi:hypothetical protein FOCC_FOCC013767 [Frankliniella occidentalis]|nr:hypothetical protein FOCC_FOCC013767 [Frankliniella occidentalis]
MDWKPHASSSSLYIVGYPSNYSDELSEESTTLPKCRSVGTQTTVVQVDAVVQTLTEKGNDKERESKGKKSLISFEKCKSNKKFKFWTGLSLEDFEILYNLIGGEEGIRKLKLHYAQNEPATLNETRMSARDRLFMFLLRMRRGLPEEELCELFGIGIGYVSELLYVMTRTVYLTLKSMEKEMFPSVAQQEAFGKPEVMKPFKNLRVILDGASFYIQTPSNFEQQGNTYSAYKSNNVLLVAIGISCNGATIFCSDAYEGCISDKETILKSNLLEMLDKGDGVMTDRGYDLTSELLEKGCYFYKPPSLGERETLTAEEEIMTKAVAAARIYVEHAVADIKDWRILQGTIPINMIGTISDMVYIAAFLRNFNRVRIGGKNKKNYHVK